MAKLYPSSAPRKTAAIDVPPELTVGLLKLVRATVLDALRAGAVQVCGDRRVRHDRTALPRRAVLAAIRSGELAAVKVGKFFYIEAGDLDAFYERHRAEQAPPGGEASDEFERAMARAGLRKGARTTAKDTTPTRQPKGRQ